MDEFEYRMPRPETVHGTPVSVFPWWNDVEIPAPGTKRCMRIPCPGNDEAPAAEATGAVERTCQNGGSSPHGSSVMDAVR